MHPSQELTQSRLADLCSCLEERYLEGLLLSWIGSNSLVSVASNSATSHHYEPATSQLANNILSSPSASMTLLVSGITASGKSEVSLGLLQALHSSHTHALTLLDAFTHSISPSNLNATRAIKMSVIHLDANGRVAKFEVKKVLLLDTFRLTSGLGSNFHCFYLLSEGAPPDTKKELFLSGVHAKYLLSVPGTEIDAAKGYKMMMRALKERGLSDDVIACVLEALAAILLIGNVEFTETSLTTCKVSNVDCLENVSTLLGADKAKFSESLTHVTLLTKTGGQVKNSLTAEQSCVMRDALARGLYTKMLDWIVSVMNDGETEYSSAKVLNLLDIPGFENAAENGLESLLVNMTFEKINHMITALAVRDRQADLANEGVLKISLDPLDNFGVCHLLMDNFRGVLQVIDESCQKTTDPKVILRNLNTVCGNSHFFASGMAIGVRASGICFKIKHYLSPVVYDVSNFKSHNIDRLSINLIEVLSACQHPALSGKFNKREKLKSVIRQTREVINDVMNSVKGTEIFTIHCIKPNSSLEMELFDAAFVTEQVKYMNLTEMIKLEKCGFKYSEKLSDFLEKFQSLAGVYPNEKPQLTCKRLMVGFSVPESDYVIGKTKIFFSSLDILDTFRQVRSISNSRSAVVVQKYARAWIARKHFKDMRRSQIVISKYFRGKRERKQFLSFRRAAIIISKYVRGYQTRIWYLWVLEERDRIFAVTIIASHFRGWQVRKRFKHRLSSNAKSLIKRFIINSFRYLYLMRLTMNLPSLSPVRFDWPEFPTFMRRTSELLFTIFHAWRCKRYRGMLTKNPAQFKLMKEKLIANNLFRKRKASYPKSIPILFQGDRLGLASNPKWKRIALQTGGFTPIVWDSNVLKINRNNGKFQDRILVVTRQDVLLIDPANFKLLQQFTLHTLKQISVSTYSDCCFIFHINTGPQILGKPSTAKGDLLFMCPHVVEVIAKTTLAVRELTNRNLPVFIQNEIEVEGKDGEKIVVEFQCTKGGQYLAHPKRHGNRLIFIL